MEIGSVLQLEEYNLYSSLSEETFFQLPFMDKEYNTVFFQSGRNGIEALLKQLKKDFSQEILLPDFMCTTVSDAVVRAGIQVSYYKISKDFSLNIDDIEAGIHDGIQILYIAHYFGKRLSDEEIQAIYRWKSHGILIIEDITLSLLSKETERVGFGNYILGSIRKWLPISDGGFLCSKEHPLPACPKQNVISCYSYYYFITQVLKRQYILGGETDKKLKEMYLSYYAASIENLFSDYTLYPITELSHNYILNCDYTAIKKTREENYDYLYEKIMHMSGIVPLVKREKGYTPFGMVVLCENRNELLQYLVSREIYCNKHWDLQNKDYLGKDAEFLSKNILTIPCDQRYNKKEMSHIIKILREWCERII